MLKNLTTSGKVNLITEGQSWMLPDLSVQRKTTNELI